MNKIKQKKASELEGETTIILIIVIAVIIIATIFLLKVPLISLVKNLPGFGESGEKDSVINPDQPIDYQEIKMGDRFSSNILAIYPSEKSVSLEVLEVSLDRILLKKVGTSMQFYLLNGMPKKIDSNNDGFYDIELTFQVSNLEAESIQKLELKNIFEEVDYSNPSEFREETYYNNIVEANPDLKNLQEYDSNYRESNEYSSEEKIINVSDYWKGYEEFSSTREGAQQIPNSYSWINSLPSRESVPLELSDLQEYTEQKGLDYVPCGAYALYKAMNQLGEDVSFEDINEQRSGGFKRGVLSMFNSEAKHITWPSEMKNIPEEYGFRVRELSGEEASLENARSLSNENSVIIMHTEDSLLAQHYQIYDTNAVRKMAQLNAGSPNFEQNIRNTEMDFPDWEIKHLYIISKE